MTDSAGIANVHVGSPNYTLGDDVGVQKKVLLGFPLPADSGGVFSVHAHVARCFWGAQGGHKGGRIEIRKSHEESKCKYSVFLYSSLAQYLTVSEWSPNETENICL